jgi:hypothetical protein
MPRPEPGRDPHVLKRPTAAVILPWVAGGVLLVLTVSLGWWGITMREQQRDLIARLQRLQSAAPDRVPPAIVSFGPRPTHARIDGPVGRWIVLVVHVEHAGDARLELRAGRVSLWTAREAARRGVVVPPALPASLLPAGEYELVVDDVIHRLTVTAAATSSGRSGRSGT